MATYATSAEVGTDNQRIDAAIAKCGSGDICHLDEGTYTLTTGIKIDVSARNGMTLRGDGVGSTTINATTGAGFGNTNYILAILALTESIDGITMEDFTLDGNTPTKSFNALQLTESTNFQITNCTLQRITVTDVIKTGFWLSGDVTGDTLTATACQNSGGSTVDGTTTLTNITCTGCTQTGWNFSAPDFGRDSIVTVDTFTFDSQITTGSGAKLGVGVEGQVSQITLKNGSLDSNAGAGFFFSSSGISDTSNIELYMTNCTSSSNGTVGLNLQLAHIVEIRNHVASNNGGIGLSYTGVPGGRALYKDITCEGNTGRGLYITKGYVQNATLKNNTGEQFYCPTGGNSTIWLDNVSMIVDQASTGNFYLSRFHDTTVHLDHITFQLGGDAQANSFIWQTTANFYKLNDYDDHVESTGAVVNYNWETDVHATSDNANVTPRRRGNWGDLAFDLENTTGSVQAGTLTPDRSSLKVPSKARLKYTELDGTEEYGDTYSFSIAANERDTVLVSAK